MWIGGIFISCWLKEMFSTRNQNISFMDDLVHRNSRSNNVRMVEQIELLFKRKWNMPSNNNTNWSCFVGISDMTLTPKVLIWPNMWVCIEALCICFLLYVHVCLLGLNESSLCSLALHSTFWLPCLFILRLVLCNLKWLKYDILYHYQSCANWRSEVKLSLWLSERFWMYPAVCLNILGIQTICSLLNWWKTS